LPKGYSLTAALLQEPLAKSFKEQHRLTEVERNRLTKLLAEIAGERGPVTLKFKGIRISDKDGSILAVWEDGGEIEHMRKEFFERAKKEVTTKINSAKPTPFLFIPIGRILDDIDPQTLERLKERTALYEDLSAMNLTVTVDRLRLIYEKRYMLEEYDDLGIISFGPIRAPDSVTSFVSQQSSIQFEPFEKDAFKAEAKDENTVLVTVCVRLPEEARAASDFYIWYGPYNHPGIEWKPVKISILASGEAQVEIRDINEAFPGIIGEYGATAFAMPKGVRPDDKELGNIRRWAGEHCHVKDAKFYVSAVPLDPPAASAGTAVDSLKASLMGDGKQQGDRTTSPPTAPKSSSAGTWYSRVISHMKRDEMSDEDILSHIQQIGKWFRQQIPQEAVIGKDNGLILKNESERITIEFSPRLTSYADLTLSVMVIISLPAYEYVPLENIPIALINIKTGQRFELKTKQAGMTMATALFNNIIALDEAKNPIKYRIEIGMPTTTLEEIRAVKSSSAGGVVLPKPDVVHKLGELKRLRRQTTAVLSAA
jgi:hypothetical protein